MIYQPIWRRFMTYFDQLHPWCLMCLLPNLQRQVIARFRRRNDAEAHMRVLQQQAPTVRYEVVFDAGGEPRGISF
jgi:hypothetical protein